MKIRMQRNYKVSYRSGWLKQNTNYDVKNIEGGEATAKRLIGLGWAEEVNDEAKTSCVVKPSTIAALERAEKEKQSKIDDDEIETARRKSRERRSIRKSAVEEVDLKAAIEEIDEMEVK